MQNDKFPFLLACKLLWDEMRVFGSHLSAWSGPDWNYQKNHMRKNSAASCTLLENICSAAHCTLLENVLLSCQLYTVREHFVQQPAAHCQRTFCSATSCIQLENILFSSQLHTDRERFAQLPAVYCQRTSCLAASCTLLEHLVYLPLHTVITSCSAASCTLLEHLVQLPALFEKLFLPTGGVKMFYYLSLTCL